jgi:hypothetical protein
VEDLPDDPHMSYKVNGIHFSNLEDYKARIGHDAEAMARLIYDIYQDKKRKEKLSRQDDSDRKAEAL